ncbi:hypothetical protein H257_05731 [Aphanomyces astaci]|uniref:Uncharacterized protein n=1 Tax=Aphanomyces astaci TaxID=112090 RepID=W4GN88_APHAT|nr:hypothetical protein H257_05731 [Aphanomyces astaci]ETV81137.1 hypothetical protein H257_05731 [Aphanomyces astaci]RQM22474.1 hypothetical protein B5M09_005854 [Aphanomyces astaci]|eukprot:XP_009828995.1 hypothetical protein H257_05731 [Aphanomyces astaci]
MDEVHVRGVIVGLPLWLRLCFYVDGTCSVEILECPDEVGHDNMVIWDTSYCVHQRTKHVQGFISIAAGHVAAKLRFVGNYDADHGTFMGKWFDCVLVDHTAGDFHFERTTDIAPQVAMHDCNLATLTPLGPGHYLFHGAAIGGNGRIYHSRMTIRLFADGSLSGTVQESHYPQTCTLAGQWSAHQLAWQTTYTADGIMSQYLYYGTPALRVLRGLWQLADVGCVHSLARESGHFDYQLEAAHRQWSRDVHHTFPRPFRRIARAILLSKPSGPSQTAATPTSCGVLLPGDLWCHVFSYVHTEWWQV